MRTGPTNKSTRELIVDLEKAGKKLDKKVWGEIAYRLSAPSRRRAQINVYKLSILAKKNKGRILVVPGKVLSNGKVDGLIEVACFSISAKAKEAIEEAKGKVMSLKDLIESKAASNKMVIVQ